MVAVCPVTPSTTPQCREHTTWGVIAGQVQEGAMAQLDTVLFYGRGEAHVIEYCDEIAGATAPPTLTDAHGRSCRVVGEDNLLNEHLS